MSLCASTTEAHMPVCSATRSHRNEKPARCNEEEPLLSATTEKLVQQQRPRIAKNKQIKLCFKKVVYRSDLQTSIDDIAGNIISSDKDIMFYKLCLHLIYYIALTF